MCWGILVGSCYVFYVDVSKLVDIFIYVYWFEKFGRFVRDLLLENVKGFFFNIR